jgi:hypothetical protein
MSLANKCAKKTAKKDLCRSITLLAHEGVNSLIDQMRDQSYSNAVRRKLARCQPSR